MKNFVKILSVTLCLLTLAAVLPVSAAETDEVVYLQNTVEFQVEVGDTYVTVTPPAQTEGKIYECFVRDGLYVPVLLSALEETEYHDDFALYYGYDDITETKTITRDDFGQPIKPGKEYGVFIYEWDKDGRYMGIAAYGYKPITTLSHSSSSPEISATADEIISGDVNYDRRITIKDATLIQKHIADLTALDKVLLLLADVNKDNSVTVQDATALQKKLANITDLNPVQ